MAATSCKTVLRIAASISFCVLSSSFKPRMRTRSSKSVLAVGNGAVLDSLLMMLLDRSCRLNCGYGITKWIANHAKAKSGSSQNKSSAGQIRVVREWHDADVSQGINSGQLLEHSSADVLLDPVTCLTVDRKSPQRNHELCIVAGGNGGARGVVRKKSNVIALISVEHVENGTPAGQAGKLQSHVVRPVGAVD